MIKFTHQIYSKECDKLMNKRSKKNASNAFQQETILHIPRSVQASIPIKKIYHDGIWEVASNGNFLQRE